MSLSAGTAICGYAVGSLEAVPDSAGGKTVAFALRQPSTSVFFERELATVSSCVGPDCDADTVAGHVLRRSEEGEVISIELDSTWEGRRYFVPSSEQVSRRGGSGNIPAAPCRQRLQAFVLIGTFSCTRVHYISP